MSRIFLCLSLLASRWTTGVALFVIAWSGPDAAAQSGGLTPPNQPHLDGQWEGPFILGGTGPAQISTTLYDEITHIAVIPPAANPSVPNGELHDDVGHVLLWCRRKACDGSCACSFPTVVCPPAGLASLYIWTPRVPQRVTPVTIPNSSEAIDPFCSGHTWLWNGDLLIAGGNDFTAGTSSPTGHRHLVRMGFASGSPVVTTSNGTNPPLSPMLHMRWYPTVIALPNRTAAVLGHSGVLGTPTPNPTQYFSRDIFDPITVPPTTNHRSNMERTLGIAGVPSNATCSASTAATDLARLGDYPRIFQLRNKLGYVAGPTAPLAGNPIFWDTTGFLQNYQAMNQGYQNPQPTCDTPIDRFLTDGVSPELIAPNHLDGGAVHLITRRSNGTGYPDGYTADGGWLETIYQFGGNDHYEAGECCGCGHQHDDGTREVERLYNPNAHPGLPFGTPSTWDDQTPHDLNVTRTDLVPVVLLDGSILVLGGEGRDSDTAPCVARKAPERLKPVEVFGGAEQDWQIVAAHAHEHRYHSVGALLPGGYVVLAGGQSKIPPAQPQQSDKSIEVYSPAYLFAGPRPIIDDMTFDGQLGVGRTMNPGDPLSFDVALEDSVVTVKRVALLRPASMTHSVDFHQRYVECLLNGQTNPVEGNVRSITITLPPDEFYTPQGWYMLTVIDSSDRPSEAKWLRIRMPGES